MDTNDQKKLTELEYRTRAFHDAYFALREAVEAVSQVCEQQGDQIESLMIMLEEEKSDDRE